MTCTWTEITRQEFPVQALQLILQHLGLDTADAADSATDLGIRLEFEDNFAVEVNVPHPGVCRLSTRICLLARNLETQDRQLVKALGLHTDLLEDLPASVSLCASEYDNCLRLCLDLNQEQWHATIHSANNPIGEAFEAFANVCLAFKKTYLNL